VTTGNRAAPIGADGSVIAAVEECATCVEDVLECISAVITDFQHTAVEAEIGVLARRFEIEVMPEHQLR
jgi:hypothetical protein